MLDRQSALASVLGRGGRDGADGKRRVRLGEQRGWSLTQIAAFAATMGDLAAAVQPLLGTALPTVVGAAGPAGSRQILKTGPAQFWILGSEEHDLTAQLRAAVAPAIGAVTPLSHSRARIAVEGEGARVLLAKGIALDLHPEVFRVEHFALTGLHHTPVLLLRSAEDRYEIFALRTFALSVWDWLIDAAMPLGYEVAG
jgi:heterotetrameric sarcosine oxidase gamma subunit